MVLAICSADVSSGWRCDRARAARDGKLANASNLPERTGDGDRTRYPLNKYGASYVRATPKVTAPDIRAYCTKFFSED
jgi:hypothetical protein